MDLNIVIGEKLYLDRSIRVNCFVCDKNSGTENHILSFLDGKKNNNSTKGLKVESSGYPRTARNGCDRKTGGYWSTLKVSVNTDTEVLFKVVINERSHLSNRNAAMYFLIRNGCDLSVTTLSHIPDFESTGTHYTETTTPILVGAHEVVEVGDVENKYGFNVNPFFKHQALNSIYKYFLDTDVIRKEVIKKPTIRQTQVEKGTGEKVVVRSRRKVHRRINL